MKVVTQLQDRAAAFVGLEPPDRRRLLDAMVGRSTADTVGYWLQLVVAMGIATLGLAMDSAAVVIGAMLIAPLMGPLIELGTGIATGSPLLTVRAGIRTAGSVALVVVGAAAITRVLPFHELTGELEARTTPTILDLFVAMFCALAAVYTTVRQSKDVMAAAAGTSIGISLVPPLCTAGYGLGTGHDGMFQGALLLFTANFAAILAVTSLIVLALGFGQVGLDALEGEALATTAQPGVPARAARLSRRVLGGRLGVLRLAIPALILVAIMVPLGRALEEVSWQVRVRGQVNELVASLPGSVVRQSLEVKAGRVRLRLFLVGGDEAARTLAAELRARIAAISGHEPVVEVVAVPDAATLDAFAAQLRGSLAPPPAPPPPLPPPPAPRFLVALDEAVGAAWPAAAGDLLRVRAAADPELAGGLVLEVVHLGPPLGDAGRELVARTWTTALTLPVRVDDRALPTAPLEAEPADGVAWLAEATLRIALADGVTGLHLCAQAPPSPPLPRRGPPPPSSIDLVRAAVDALARTRPTLTLAPGPRWRLELRREPCQPPA